MKHNPSTKPIDKLIRQNIISKNNIILENRNHSLKLLMHLKMLPPLHPQTDSKKINTSKNCPELQEEELFTIHHPQMAVIAKSEKLVPFDTSTAKFGFEKVDIQTSLFGKDTIQFQTLQNDLPQQGEKSNELGVTFGKRVLKVQNPNQNIKALPQMKSMSKKGKYFIPKVNPLTVQKSERSLFKLGKYDCIFKAKQNQNNETEPSKYGRNAALQNIRLKEKVFTLLPPIPNKN